MRQDSQKDLNLPNCTFLKLENSSDRVGFLPWIEEFRYEEYYEKNSRWIVSFLPDEKKEIFILFCFVLLCFPNLYCENLMGFLELKHMNVQGFSSDLDLE